MAITLAEYNSTRQDKFDLSAVIDEFQKSSVLLDDLIWDDTVMPTGSSFVYGYNKVTTESGAGVRSVNGTYTTSDAKMQKMTAEVKILGGKYSIDRAIAKASKDSFLDEVQFQSSQKVKATRAVFNDLFINGKATTSGQFDGINKLLTGSSTVFESEVDVSTSAKINENYMAFLDEIDGAIAAMDGAPTHILMNTKAFNIFRSISRRVSQWQETRDTMGRTIATYAGAKLVDMGAKAGSSNPVIPTSTDGTTDIYFVRIGMDGVHGITLKNNMIDVVTPDFGAQGAEQLNGLVEMYAGIALKNSKAAAKLQGIQVVPKPTPPAQNPPSEG